MVSNVVLGLLVGLAVIVGGVVTSTNNWKIFLDFHALVVVLGGTTAATLICFPLSQISKLAKLFVTTIAGKSVSRHIQVIDEIVELAARQNAESSYILNNIEFIKTPFLREALELQAEGGIPNHKVDEILRKRAEVYFVRYEDEANFFKIVSRFPPAFGLLGAVLGMVSLLSGLGTPESFKTIGPAMAMAMVATMYGIALANFVFIPLGEHLSKLTKEDFLMRNIVIDGIKLLREREHPLIVQEHLKSYLLHAERRALASNQKVS